MIGKFGEWISSNMVSLIAGLPFGFLLGGFLTHLLAGVFSNVLSNVLGSAFVSDFSSAFIVFVSGLGISLGIFLGSGLGLVNGLGLGIFYASSLSIGLSIDLGMILANGLGLGIFLRSFFSVGLGSYFSRKAKVAEGVSKERKAKPYRFAEKMLYLFLPKKQREHVPGDLEEEFTTIILPKFGPRFAMRWYWFQVIRTIVANHPWALRFIAYGGGSVGFYQVAKGVLQGWGWIESDEDQLDLKEKQKHR